MNETNEIRANLFSLIDKIENKALLEMVYDILESKKTSKNVLENLTPLQKDELNKSYHESFIEGNLVDLETFKAQSLKWLEK